MHVLAGVQVFIEPVGNGCHDLKWCLAQIHWSQIQKRTRCQEVQSVHTVKNKPTTPTKSNQSNACDKKNTLSLIYLCHLCKNIQVAVAYHKCKELPICPAMTGGRTTSSTNLSSRRWRNRTTGSSWAELSAAMLDLSSASRLFSMMRMSPILTGNMCSSRACTKAKNLSRYWSWRVGAYKRGENTFVCKIHFIQIIKHI